MTDTAYTPTRRAVLGKGLALGCSLAASPLLSPVTLAALPGEARLVVIVLRGGMDGLDVLRPLGDPHFAALRPGAATDGPALDDLFVLHPALAGLLPLWRQGELAFAHATSTPYRDRRSHFDGQDFLENGGKAPDGTLTDARDGWLNRTLTTLPGATARTGFTVGRTEMPVLRGRAPTSVWAPDGALDLSPQAERLLGKLYGQDPLFAASAARAIELARLTEDQMTGRLTPRNALRAKALAEFAAARLREQTRLVGFSLNGWDTHGQQATHLPRALSELSTAILTLRAGLGAQWSKTVVMCLTEFGRTARLNGSAGSDHGTGGAAVFAGGALAGGQIVSQWPGLSEDALYKARDLMPTRDLRALMGWVLRDHLGVAQSAVETTIFPGVEMGRTPGLIG